MRCSDDDALTELVEDRLSRAGQLAVRRHLLECARCRAVVAVLGGTTVIARGAAVGRYVVDAVLGAGAFGVVYAARDPVLDRRVALKLPRAARDAAAGVLAQARLMARVEHPHVVAVYDAGESPYGPYVAMQLVDGDTVARWAVERAWPEVVATFTAIAGALAAIHDAELAHGDVKPDNIVVDPRDRALLIDFGATTEPDVAVGAAGYLAPELARGRPPSAAGDQYAWCAALRAVLGPERFAACPARVQAAVLRGLREHPAQRHASMAALCGELELPAAPRAPRVHGAPRLDDAWARLVALRDGGDYVAGREAADALWADARRTADGQAAARTQLHRAELHAGAGAFAFAEDCFHAALISAERTGAERLRLAALQGLTHVVGHHLRRTTEGLRFSDQALPLLERLGGGEIEHARWCSLRGAVLGLRGALDDAGRYHDEALARLAAASSASELDRAEALIFRGEIDLFDPDRRGVARALFAEAAAIRARVLGPDHPLVGLAQTPLAFVQIMLGDAAAARVTADAAVGTLRARLGDETPRLAVPLQALAQAHAHTGDRRGAVALFERSRALLDRGSGVHTARLATVLSSLAAVVDDDARAERLRDEARGLAQTALDRRLLEVAPVGAIRRPTDKCSDVP
jgi:tetratricopeptide (TPR) repeat protein